MSGRGGKKDTKKGMAFTDLWGKNPRGKEKRGSHGMVGREEYATDTYKNRWLGNTSSDWQWEITGLGMGGGKVFRGQR